MDDNALISDQIEQAQELLTRVGLRINEKKTVVMPFNNTEEVQLKTRKGSPLKYVVEFKYLGAWTSISEKDAWMVCHKLQKIWASILPRLFLSAVESMQLYGSEAWTVTKQMEKRIDGSSTRMLRMVVSVHNNNILQMIQCMEIYRRERRKYEKGDCIS